MFYWRNSSFVLLAGLACLNLAGPASSEPWPQWRGPRGDGTSLEKNVPLEWSSEKNVLWKADLSGKSASTPIVWGDRVFITTQLGRNPIEESDRSGPGGRRGSEGAAAPAPAEDAPAQFVIQCFSAADGKELWRHEVKPEGELARTHAKHNLASPSCVTDGEGVYAWFATGQLLRLDNSGKQLWQKNPAAENGAFEVKWGHGASPILFEDSLIVVCDHATAYVAAYDKKTGAQKWKTAEGLSGRGYSTPIVIEAEGKKEMVVNTAHAVTAYNPSTGEWLWKATGLDRVMSASPVYADGVIYTSGGWRNAPFMAVRPGGRGDVTATHVLWHKKNGAPYTPSIVAHGKEIFSADNGIANCYDAATGELVWRERLAGGFSASPVVAEGRVYVPNEEGETFVFEAGRTFKLLSRNPLEGRTLASLAISEGRVFARTDDHLYCIGPK